MGNEKCFKENKNGRIYKQILIQLHQQLNDEIRQIENVHLAHLTTQGSPRWRTAYWKRSSLSARETKRGAQQLGTLPEGPCANQCRVNEETWAGTRVQTVCAPSTDTGMLPATYLATDD